MRLPYWFPNLSAWMSAIFLLLLTGGLGVCLQAIWRMGTAFAYTSPRLSIFFTLLGLVFPIILIAFAHHLLHLFLDRFFPASRLPGMNNVQGWLPSLMSWWEGLYGWLVLILATIVSVGILGIIYYSPASLSSLYLFLWSWDKAKHFFTLPSIAWIVIAACLYQFEFVVSRHLMAIGRQNQE